MSNNFIYLDNAATTRVKPEEVYNAFNYYAREIGVSPGRGSHFLAVEASRCLYKSRKAVAQYFGCPEINHVIFTKNSTEAANLLIRGILKKGDHVLISSFEHNALLRPVHYLKQNELIEYDVFKVFLDGSIDIEKLSSMIKSNTKLLILSLASNLTGKILYNKDIAKFAHDNGIKILLDASQGAGRIKLNMKSDGIDYVVFTGHKDLYGLPGSGGICSFEQLDIDPLLQGGTGYSDGFVNPDIYPEKLEAGTHNMPAIWSLKAGIEYISNNINNILEKESKLHKALYNYLSKRARVKIYGNDNLKNNLPIILFNIAGIDCQEVSRILSEYCICIRSGMHCSILGHMTLDTEKIGAVRVSLDYQNTEEDVYKFIEAIDRICEVY